MISAHDITMNRVFDTSSFYLGKYDIFKREGGREAGRQAGRQAGRDRQTEFSYLLGSPCEGEREFSYRV